MKWIQFACCMGDTQFQAHIRETGLNYLKHQRGFYELICDLILSLIWLSESFCRPKFPW